MSNKLRGVLGAFYLTSSISIDATDEAMTDSGNHLVYTIADTDKRYWSTEDPVLVYVDGLLVTSGYTIDYVGGTITFTISKGASIITVDCSYLEVEEAGAFYNYKISLEKNQLEANAFGDTWSGNETGIKSWTITAEKHYLNDDIMAEKVITGAKIVVIAYIDTITNMRYEGYGSIGKVDIDTNINALIKQSIEIKGNGKLYFID